MRNILFIVAMLPLGLFASDNAKEGIETGKVDVSFVVVDKVSGESLAGVAVYVDNSLIGYTDLNGNINKDLVSGRHSLSASYISYQAKSMEVNLNGPAKLVIELENIN